MKKILPILLCLLLCACTEKSAEQPPAQQPTEPPAVETVAPVTLPPIETTEPEPEAGPSAFEAAKALEGESVEELLSAVGEPVSREDYMPSCLGDGEDGLWHYSGFDVYTYRMGENESVYSVESN